MCFPWRASCNTVPARPLDRFRRKEVLLLVKDREAKEKFLSSCPAEALERASYYARYSRDGAHADVRRS